MAAAPKRRNAPPPPPSKPFPVLQLALIGIMSVVSLVLIYILAFYKKEEPPPESKPVPVATKPASKPATNPTTIKEIPKEVMAKIYKALDQYSSQVDPLERREAEADKIEDAEKRYNEYEELSGKYSENREGIGDELEKEEYAIYRNNPDYGPTWQGYESRLKYWQNKMNAIKKKRDQAFIEMKAAKEKEKKG